MINQMERRLRTAAQIAKYGGYLGLLPYQIDEAVRIGVGKLDEGDRVIVAYEAGCQVLDAFALNQATACT